jgi:hypothetical protein
MLAPVNGCAPPGRDSETSTHPPESRRSKPPFVKIGDRAEEQPPPWSGVSLIVRIMPGASLSPQANQALSENQRSF